MPGQEDDLLRRLNALKPSSVQLDPLPPSIEVESSNAPQSVEDKLAARLKTLRGGGGGDSGLERTVSSSSRTARAPPLSPQVRDVGVSELPDRTLPEKDPIRNWQQHEPDDEQTLEELLAELGPAQGGKLAWLDPEDPKHIDSLLKEAREALPQEPDSGLESSTREADSNLDVESSKQASHEDQADQSDPEQDELDADDYIKKVLAELDIEKKYGGGEDDAKDDESSQEKGDGLDLPSTPSTLKDLPSNPSEKEPPSYEDSELEARFSKLGLSGLGLPSAPTNKPSSTKPTVTASLKPKAKSNLPTYTDEDIDSWCCICNEDGELRCLGCDGDIYCQNCWNDGHGTGLGQERGHKAVQYNKKPPKAAAA